MKKEYEKFTASNLFEGMTSISALLNARAAGINSRPIYEIRFDKNRLKQKAREYHFLQRKSEELGFPLSLVEPEEITAEAIGNTHGGILARCGDRIFPALTSPDQLGESGFYVLLEGIEDHTDIGHQEQHRDDQHDQNDDDIVDSASHLAIHHSYPQSTLFSFC